MSKSATLSAICQIFVAKMLARDSGSQRIRKPRRSGGGGGVKTSDWKSWPFHLLGTRSLNLHFTYLKHKSTKMASLGWKNLHWEEVLFGEEV